MLQTMVRLKVKLRKDAVALRYLQDQISCRTSGLDEFIPSKAVYSMSLILTHQRSASQGLQDTPALACTGHLNVVVSTHASVTGHARNLLFCMAYGSLRCSRAALDLAAMVMKVLSAAIHSLS